MANPHLGEVKFKAGEDEYTLSFSANALCELSVVLDLELDKLIELFASGKVTLPTLRTIFWQGLCDHHDGITLDDTKKILKRIRGVEMGELVGRAFTLAMPQPENDGSSASPPKPDGPQVGTGPASSTDGATPEEASPNSGG